MWRVGVALLAAGLLGLPLQACSRSQSPPPDVVLTATRQAADTADPKAKLEADQLACTEEAKRKGISSVTRILLLRGKISKSDYIACMETKGYVSPEE